MTILSTNISYCYYHNTGSYYCHLDIGVCIGLGILLLSLMSNLCDGQKGLLVLGELSCLQTGLVIIIFITFAGNRKEEKEERQRSNKSGA